MVIQATNRQIESAKRIFRRHGGILKTGEALDQGIHRRTLYTMRDAGILERLDRGLYRLADLPPLSDPDLVTVARKIPHGVICLISALHSIAVNRGTEPPRLDFPPIQIYWFSGEAFSAGVDKQSIDNTTIRVYSAEKTLADCFKYRNKIGMDTVLEALAFYRERKKFRPRKLIQFARVCRVEKIMRPYLEASL